ncbi:hypothetical protein [Candidatus Clostridium stratigraminis]|uniref:Uncharacterized protein n=1 Tax=Candidatus Clostridium stratigraminis TaxID=3381661 RepID=A0ABW8T3J3_9CLOT
MSRGGIRYLFRYIVYFTISNADKYLGNETEKAYAILNALRREEPWLLSSLQSSYIPEDIITYIITTIIMFTLENISTPVAP